MLRRDGVAAEDFYLREIFPLVLRRIGVADESARPYVLISNLGTSFEPVVLMAAHLRPAKIMLLATGKSASLGERVRAFASPHLASAEILVRTIHQYDPQPLYDAVIEGKRLAHGGKLACDLTTGTKAMAGALAMAAMACEGKVFYVSSDFDASVRRPVPGSERIVCIPMPPPDLGRELEGAVGPPQPPDSIA